MFIAALFTEAKLWKQLICPTTRECIKKMWYVYTMEFYSATKKNESFSFASKWMELENVILSEISLKTESSLLGKLHALLSVSCLEALLCGDSLLFTSGYLSV
jgi:hypothetical protein